MSTRRFGYRAEAEFHFYAYGDTQEDADEAAKRIVQEHLLAWKGNGFCTTGAVPVWSTRKDQIIEQLEKLAGLFLKPLEPPARISSETSWRAVDFIRRIPDELQLPTELRVENGAVAFDWTFSGYLKLEMRMMPQDTVGFYRNRKNGQHEQGEFPVSDEERVNELIRWFMDTYK